MKASEEVKAFPAQRKKEEIPSPERCREILLTTDGLGKEKKAVALWYLETHARNEGVKDQPLHTKNVLVSYKAEIDRLKAELGQPVCKPGDSGEATGKRTKIANCFYCDKVVENPTKDHFIPKVKGGRAGINFVAACAKCNTRKADKLPTPDQIRKYFALWKRLGIDLTQFIEKEEVM